MERLLGKRAVFRVLDRSADLAPLVRSIQDLRSLRQFNLFRMKNFSSTTSGDRRNDQSPCRATVPAALETSADFSDDANDESDTRPGVTG